MNTSEPHSLLPLEVLQEAREDTSMGRNEEALKKFLWFHHNALEYDMTLVGVRLSFALGYWGELAKKYEPAKRSLQEIRDECKDKMSSVLIDTEKFQNLFSEYHELNRALEELHSTVDHFKKLHLKRKLPLSIYQLVEKELIKAEEYLLCSEYMDIEILFPKELKFYREIYEHEEEWKIQNPDLPAPPSAYLRFMKQVCLWIIVLVHTDRIEEARELKNRTLKEVEEEEFKASFELKVDELLN